MSPASVDRVGLVTAIGDSTLQAATSFAAGLSGYRESGYFGRAGTAMVLAHLDDDWLPELPDTTAEDDQLSAFEHRLLRLAIPALTEALDGASGTVPLVLALPEAEPGGAPLEDAILERLATQVEGIDVANSSLVHGGQAIGFEALAQAIQLLETHPAVVCGGIDSLVDFTTLRALDAEGRVLAEGVMDGFAPGEAAGFLRLGREGGAVTLAAHATADEPGHRGSDETLTGAGLAQAIGGATRERSERSIATVFAGMNGESIESKEWGVAQIRNARAFAEDCGIEHPADCLGAAGAAMVPVLVGLAATGLERGTTTGDCLVWCGADDGLRGAAVLTCDQERS